MDTKQPSETPAAHAVEGTASVKTNKPPLSNQTPSDNQPTRVVESDLEQPLPGMRKAMVRLDMTRPIGADLNIDKDTVVYLLYLLYKTNMIARNNLRNMIDEISKPLPDNVLKWLVNEAAKVGR